MVSRVASRVSLSKAEASAAVDGGVGCDSGRAYGVRHVLRQEPAGESIEIAASKSPAFKAGKTLRDAVR